MFIPDTTLSPNQDEQADDYFNTVLYTGNDGTQTISSFSQKLQLEMVQGLNILQEE